MILEEVINNPIYSYAIECYKPFEMKVVVEGYTNYYKPIDFRLNKIHIPLKSNDIDILYAKESKESEIFKDNLVTRWYYPPSTHFTLPDGVELVVLRYGPIRYFNGMPRVNCYCKLANEDAKLIETISNTEVVNKVLKEMNNILISNDELKRHLSQYNANWILYNDTQADDAKESKAHRKLDNIGYLEYKEMYSIQNDIRETFETITDATSSIPTSTLNDVEQFAIDFTRKRYQICYDNVVKMFRMKAIANWLVYINIYRDAEIDYRYISILNKYRKYMNIEMECDTNPLIGCDMTYNFTLPADSPYDYRIQLYQVSEYDREYVSYNIDELRIFEIDKESGEETELAIQDQNNYFEMFVMILEILSGDVDNYIMTDYYYGVPEMIESIAIDNTINNNENDLNNDGEETPEQQIVRYINNVIDEAITETTDRKVVETISSHILAGSGNVTPSEDEETEEEEKITEITYNAGGSSF